MSYWFTLILHIWYSFRGRLEARHDEEPEGATEEWGDALHSMTEELATIVRSEVIDPDMTIAVNLESMNTRVDLDYIEDVFREALTMVVDRAIEAILGGKKWDSGETVASATRATTAIRMGAADTVTLPVVLGAQDRERSGHTVKVVDMMVGTTTAVGLDGAGPSTGRAKHGKGS